MVFLQSRFVSEKDLSSPLKSHLLSHAEIFLQNVWVQGKRSKGQGTILHCFVSASFCFTRIFQYIQQALGKLMCYISYVNVQVCTSEMEEGNVVEVAE